MTRAKSLYLLMNENQHVGKVGNALVRIPKYTRMGKNVWPACRRVAIYVCTLVQSTAICVITFSAFLSRVIRVSTRIRHDGILPSKTAETPSHKSAGPPRWFIYLLRGIELPLCRQLVWSELAHIAYVSLQIASGRTRARQYYGCTWNKNI